MLNLQHNVVTILYTIKGAIEVHFARFEEGRFQGKDDALSHAHQILKRIYEQANRALAITRRISLAMKAQRKPEEVLSEASVKEVWAETLGILAERGLLGEVEVIEHIPREYPLIRCSRQDLLEIFYALAQNALEAMRYRGRLIIRANLQFSYTDRPLALIMVSDTGPGMSEEVLSRLFDPFFTTKSLEEGNGLGLCLVKGLVKRNGGGINVQSFKGCGTTFMLSFQVAGLGASAAEDRKLTAAG